MSQYQIRDQSGSAFKNQRKTSDSHADFTGEGLVNGQPVWINIWAKTDKNGNPWYSVSFKNKQPKQDAKDESEAPF